MESTSIDTSTISSSIDNTAVTSPVSPAGDRDNSTIQQQSASFNTASVNEAINTATEPVAQSLVNQIEPTVASQASTAADTTSATTTASSSNYTTKEAVVDQLTPLQPATSSVYGQIFAADNSGSLPSGYHVEFQDSNRGTVLDGQLSPGDIMTVKDKNGNIVTQDYVIPNQAYDAVMRSNLRDNALQNWQGWTSTGSDPNNTATLPNHQLANLEVRSSTDAQGKSHEETVLARNAFWEQVKDSAGLTYLQMRERNDAGEPIKATEAIKDLFNHAKDYQLSDASGFRAVNLAAMADTVQQNNDQDFNNHAGRILLAGNVDQYKTPSNNSLATDAGFNIKVRPSTNDANQLANFDPNAGDRIQIGNVYAMNNGSGQMSYMMYLGRGDMGSYQFWSPTQGAHDIVFDANWHSVDTRTGQSTASTLTSYIATPDINRTTDWDSTSRWPNF